MEAESVDVKKLKDISFFELSEEKTLKWLSQEKKCISFCPSIALGLNWIYMCLDRMEGNNIAKTSQ